MSLKKGVLPRALWPKTHSGEGKPLADYPQLKGIFLGGCVARGVGSSFRATAHAHTGWPSAYHGWICIRKPERLHEHSLLMHELAHLVTGEGHTDAFRDKAKQLGGRFRPKRARPRRLTKETADYFRLLGEFKVVDNEWSVARRKGEPERSIIARLAPTWRATRAAYHAEAERLGAMEVAHSASTKRRPVTNNRTAASSKEDQTPVWKAAPERTFLLIIPHSYLGKPDCSYVRIAASSLEDAWGPAGDLLGSRALLMWLIGISPDEFVTYDDLMEMSVAKIMRESGITLGQIQMFECPSGAISDPITLPPRPASTGLSWFGDWPPSALNADQVGHERHHGGDDDGDGHASD